GRTALAQLAMPNGRLPQIGDTKRGPLAKDLGDQVDFVRTQGEAGTAPTETAVAYDRGYVVSRSGWGERRPLAQESHMLVRFGDDLLSHSHQDRGSVHLYSRGMPWLVFSGCVCFQTRYSTVDRFST